MKNLKNKNEKATIINPPPKKDVPSSKKTNTHTAPTIKPKKPEDKNKDLPSAPKINILTDLHIEVKLKLFIQCLYL